MISGGTTISHAGLAIGAAAGLGAVGARTAASLTDWAAGPIGLDAAVTAVLHAGLGAWDLDELAGLEERAGVAGGEDGGGHEADGEELVHHFDGVFV